MSAFFTVHQDLPREGPGDRESLDWALAQTSLAPDAHILDAACGPGADLMHLKSHVPHGRVIGIDAHAPFVAAATARCAGQAGIRVTQGDMADPGGPYDMIWCAGALYFLGVERGLTLWRSALASGGIVAFSEPVILSDPLPAGARDFWEGYAGLTDEAGIRAAAAAAGYTVRATRVLPDAAWEAYYTPLSARIDALRATGPDADLRAVLDAAAAEVAQWRTYRRDTGYLQVVAQLA